MGANATCCEDGAPRLPPEDPKDPRATRSRECTLTGQSQCPTLEPPAFGSGGISDSTPSSSCDPGVRWESCSG